VKYVTKNTLPSFPLRFLSKKELGDVSNEHGETFHQDILYPGDMLPGEMDSDCARRLAAENKLQIRKRGNHVERNFKHVNINSCFPFLLYSVILKQKQLCIVSFFLLYI
jgi:hypothetical protein